MGYLDKALGAMRQQRIRVIDHNLIDRTLREIGETYRPGLLGWLKEDRSRWRRLLSLEDNINRAALTADEIGLRAGLEAYKIFFREVISLYERAEALPLFGGRR